MSNQKDTTKNNIEEITTTVPHLKSFMVWIFLTIAFLTLMLGIFTVLSVIIDSIQQNQLNYPDAVIIGFLLIFGGISLLGGTFIMKNWAPQPQINTLDDTSDTKK